MEYSKGDNGKTYYAWGQGNIKPYNKKGNYNFIPITEEAVDHVLRKFSEGGGGVSEEEVKTIIKLRDDTIMDMKEARRVSEEIKKVSTIQEL